MNTYTIWVTGSVRGNLEIIDLKRKKFTAREMKIAKTKMNDARAETDAGEAITVTIYKNGILVIELSNIAMHCDDIYEEYYFIYHEKTRKYLLAGYKRLVKQA